MKMYVIGAGAVGSLIAAEMYRNGQDVILVEDNDRRREQIRYHGVAVRQGGVVTHVQVPIADRMRGEADWIILAVPTPDIYDAYRQNADYLETGRILTVQGTVHADTLLCAHFDRALMCSSIFDHVVDIDGEGVVSVIHNGGWYLGKPYFLPDPQLRALTASLPVTLRPSIVMDVSVRQWGWVVYQIAQTVPALIGASYKECYADPVLVNVTLQCMREALTVMREARAVWRAWDARYQTPLDMLLKDQRRESEAFFQNVWTAWSCDAPMTRHLRQGIPTEIEYINGEVVHLAQHLGLEAPLNRRCVEMVHQVEMGVRGAYDRDEIVGALQPAASSPTRI